MLVVLHAGKTRPTLALNRARMKVLISRLRNQHSVAHQQRF